ncbi:hypothetical protein Ctob_016481 [Chrysochromulina tobinii]|uniref:Uncharacterized protein n=1 Tax=Chrysochromulina tobinii TaxID=1460289 RepID=A0A0M0K909_9EUKA|nr:hypothetical protein Ctob_016481 [Chrysochromulina tobinii]|eukprot:KOO35067.1 hypothetical protein Ctob_016481 [Chrysochromulina sp. CCMP291]
MPFEIDARAWTEPMGAASNALLHDEGDAASAQDDALEVVPQMAAVAERGPKQVGMPLPVRRGAATTTTGERDDENELSDSSDSVDVGVKDVGVKDVGVKDVGVKDVDDESEGQMGKLEEEDDDDAGDSLGAMGDSEDEGEELEELGTEDADDVQAVEEDEEGEASIAHDGA